MTKAGSTKLKARKNMAEMLLFQTAKWPELDDDDDADDGDDGLPACRSRLRCLRLAMMNARPGPARPG